MLSAYQDETETELLHPNCLAKPLMTSLLFRPAGWTIPHPTDCSVGFASGFFISTLIPYVTTSAHGVASCKCRAGAWTWCWMAGFPCDFLLCLSCGGVCIMHLQCNMQTWAPDTSLPTSHGLLILVATVLLVIWATPSPSIPIRSDPVRWNTFQLVSKPVQNLSFSLPCITQGPHLEAAVAS